MDIFLEDDIILGAEEACDYLKLSKVTLLREARKGTIPAFKVAGKWKFRKRMLNEWMVEKIKEGTSARYKEHLRRIKRKVG